MHPTTSAPAFQLSRALRCCTLAWITAACAQAATVIENFESFSAGTTASAAGWSVLSGDNIDKWIVMDTRIASPAGYPASPAGNGGNSFSHEATSGVLQMKKAFSAAPGFTHSDTLYYSAWAVPSPTGSGVQGVRFGVAAGSLAYMIPLFGIEPSATTANAKFFVSQNITGSSRAFSTNTFASNHWYEFELRIDQSSGATTPTLSLFARDVTAGETSLSSVAGLENVTITLTGDVRAANWSSWAISSSFRQNVDELRLSTGSIAIPEPASAATLSALAGGIVAAGGRRKRRRADATVL